MKQKKIVHDGYNAMANEYLASRAMKAVDMRLLGEFIRKLPANAQVLDAGCGAGIPIAKKLSEHFDVTGVDFSEKQIELAKANVPGANFLCRDMTKLDFPEDTFEGICSFYAIIHIPREEHRAILNDFYRMLKPGGTALLCLGADSLEDDIDEDFHGQRMYWSHFDAETYQEMLMEIGFNLLSAEIVPDETYGGRHLFVLAQKGAS